MFIATPAKMPTHASKRFRRIGTRYEKLAQTFLGFVLLTAYLDWIYSEVRRQTFVPNRFEKHRN